MCCSSAKMMVLGSGVTTATCRVELEASDIDRLRAAGVEDFELETYTLPVLPAEVLARDGVVGTMAAEMWACALALGLEEGGGAAAPTDS